MITNPFLPKFRIEKLIIIIFSFDEDDTRNRTSESSNVHIW